MVVVSELRHKYKLIDLLKLVGIPRSTYYYCLQRIQQPDKYAELKEVIRQIYSENKGRYGYRRITMELHNRGYIINHKTLQRLMKQLQLKSMVRIKKYKSYRGNAGEIAPNLLQRNFKAAESNQKWVTDVTGSLYLAKNYIYHQYSTCTMEKLSATIFHQDQHFIKR